MARLVPLRRWFGPDWSSRLRGGARRHWMFLALAVVGFGLRVVTQIAYRPALLFIDSYRYLENLESLDPVTHNPIGYDVFLLRPVLWLGNLATVAALQHIIAIGMAAAIYAVLVRRGARRWVAALAVVPLLLDGYELHIEQNIMSETLFQALVVAGVVVLLWNRRPSTRALAVGGALLGLAVTVRIVGGVLLLPAVAFAMVAGVTLRQRLTRGIAIGLAFAVPVLMYVGYYTAYSGTPGLNSGDARLLYGRAAVIVVDCRGLDLPSYERVLCPKEPMGHRLGINQYAHASPYPDRVHPPHGQSKKQVLRDFARRVFLHQPLDFAWAVLKDFARGFAWSHTMSRGDPPLERWQFQRTFPVYPPFRAGPAIRDHGGGGPRVNESLAVFLRDYQLSVGSTPGPLLGLAFLGGILGAAGVGRARRSGLRAACALSAACGVGLLLAADLFVFSWRYQLPSLVLAPLSGALGLTAMTGWREGIVAIVDEAAPTPGSSSC